MKSEEKCCSYSDLDEAQLILTYLRFMNNKITEHIMNSSESESKLQLSNAIIIYAECIDMYAERLEKIIDKLIGKGE